MTKRKTQIRCLVFLALMCCAGVGEVKASVVDTVTFVDTGLSAVTFKTPTAASRSRRPVSGRGGYVNVDVESWPSDKPDSWVTMVKACISLACEAWGNILEYGDSVMLNLKFSSSQADDIRTSVPFYAENDVSYPYPLLRKLHSDVSNVVATQKAVVSINPDAGWDIGMGGAVGGKNLTLAMMRSIAAAMGFGSSFSKDVRNRILRQTTAYVVFDYHVKNMQGECLADISLVNGNTTSTVVNEFVQSRRGDLYFDAGTATYNVYAPDPFENQKSLRFLNVANTLMSVSPSDSLDLEIDDVTKHILETLGWNLSATQGMDIVCDGADSTGTASAYQQHKCYLSSSDIQFSSRKWTCMLPKPDGEYKVVSTSTTAEVYIPVITDASQYSLTSDGEIKAIVLFEGISGGEIYKAERQIWLQLKPQISYISNPVFTPSVKTDGDYTLDMDVAYEGCYYLYVTVKPQFAPYQTIYYSDSPYFTHFQFSDVDFWGNVKITFTGVNDYGNTTKTIILNIPASSRLAGHHYIMAEKSSLYPEFAATDTLRPMDVCTFRLSDGHKADWRLEMEDCESWSPVRESANSDELTIEVNTELTNFSSLKSYQEANGRIVHRGRVYAVQDGMTDFMEVFFSVYPERPSVREVRLTYDYFDEEGCELVNSLLYINMAYSPDTKRTLQRWGYVDGHGNIEFVPAFNYGYVDTLIVEGLDFDYAYRYWAINEFGYSPDTTLFSNDYIDDFYVDEYRKWQVTQGVDDAAVTSVGIDIKVGRHGELTVVSSQGTPQRLTLIDLQGRVISMSQGDNTLAYPANYRGMAVVNIEMKRRSFRRKVML